MFLPPANEVWGKVICLQVCVCPQGGMPGPGGGVAGGAWSWGVSGPGGFSPGGKGGLVPGRWGCLVQGEELSGPRGVTGGDLPGGYCCGRYASYWYAFLLHLAFWFHWSLFWCGCNLLSQKDAHCEIILLVLRERSHLATTTQNFYGWLPILLSVHDDNDIKKWQNTHRYRQVRTDPNFEIRIKSVFGSLIFRNKNQ